MLLGLFVGTLGLSLFMAASCAYAESITFSTLPEPGTVLLMGFGLAVIGLFHKQGRRFSKSIRRWFRARMQR